MFSIRSYLICYSFEGVRISSSRQAETVAFDGVADVEVVDPARAKVEVALPQLGGIGNDGANAESASILFS